MDIPKFLFDYSFINLEALKSQCITPDEIETLFYDGQTHYDDWHSTDGYGYMIGYSFKNKFVSFTFSFTDEGKSIRLLDIYHAYRDEIKNRYFGAG
jgi:hypothetical protein